jgi:glutamate dehydrogenase (NAD(P)+)
MENSSEIIDFVDSAPLFICKVEDNMVGLKGFLVVDSIIGGHCAGGVRITQNVTEGEVKELARAMTMKYGFLNIPMGGAKSGILKLEKNQLDNKKHKLILMTFGEKLKIFLQKGIYYPGTDIGTDEEDIEIIKQGAGISNKGQIKNKSIKSGYYTALAAVTAAREISQFAGIKFLNAKVIIEGFGKVGSAIATEICKDSILVGTSTLKGAIYNDKGLDILKLINSYQRSGDNFINEIEDADILDVDNLLSMESDILFLCGKPKVITLNNSKLIKAKIIVGAGNLCFEKGVLEQMINRGIYVLPDYMTSCGEVLGLSLEERGLIHENIVNFIENEYASKIRKFLNASWKSNKSPNKVAEEIVNENLNRMIIKKNKKAEGKLKQVYNMMRQRKWQLLKTKTMINIVPKRFYHLQRMQDYLLQTYKDKF